MRPQRLLLIIAILLPNIGKLFANSNTGASISLTKTANTNEYQVRLYICHLCPFSTFNTTSVSVSSASLGNSGNLTVNLISATFLTANPCMPAQGYNCTQGYGINELIYEGTALLPPAADWVIAYEECCRNPVITNLTNPYGNYLYVNAKLDNLNFPGNSTPDFNTPPIVYVCLNTLNTLYNTAIDPDLDSISYQLVNPMDVAGTSITTYSSGLSPLNFISSSTPVACNAVNGDVQFTPAVPQIVVMAIRATEHRNGMESATVTRDVMLIVTNNPVGINENNSDQSISIYPVPATDYISIDLPDDIGLTEIKVYNLQGALVETLTASGKVTVDVSKMVQGLYTVQCRSDAGVFTSRFVK